MAYLSWGFKFCIVCKILRVCVQIYIYLYISPKVTRGCELRLMKYVGMNECRFWEKIVIF